MKRMISLAGVVLLVFAASCSKPLITATASDNVLFMSRDYGASANDLYYATRWALGEAGYPIAREDLQDGVITTAWLPVKSDSHYVPVFDRRDFGVTNSYYRLEIRIEPDGGQTEVKVGSRVKGIVSKLRSSGIEEDKILARIGDYVRKGEPEITNLGIEE